MNYGHKGIDIIFNVTGATFSATLKDGKVIRSSSLAAIKKQIDKAQQEVFEPFDALQYHNFYSVHSERGTEKCEIPPIYTLKVLRVEKNQRGRYNSPKFVVEPTGESKDKGRYRYGRETAEEYWVVPDTEQAREAIKNYYEVAVRGEKERARINKEIEEARAKIPHVNAENYNANNRIGAT